MTERWVPWTAAALATGASALVMGALTLPSSSAGRTGVLRAVEANPDRWLMAAAALLYAAFALTAGIPTFLYLLRHRPRSAILGASLLAFGAIGLSGYAGLLILVRALTLRDFVSQAELAAVTSDVGLRTFIGAFIIAFALGLLVLGLMLLLTGVVQRWIAIVMVVFPLLMPFTDRLPEGTQAVQVVALGAALIGVALAAKDEWASTPRQPRAH